MEDSGGGGSVGTNWSGSNVRQLWELVKDQETEPHWQLVTGWRRSSDLTIAHLSRMQLYRDNLARAWPPERNPAAKVYIDELDRMIGNLRETYEAAVANYGTFATTTGALSTARRELKELYDQYVANEDAIQRYEQAKAAAVPTPSRTPSPTPGPSALPSTPPVAPEQQEQLNWKARTVMYQLSGTLVEARAVLKTPQPYVPRASFRDNESVEVGASGAPAIPPITLAPDGSEPPRAGTRTPVPGNIGTATGITGGGNGPSLVGTAPIISPPNPPTPGLPPGPGLPPVTTSGTAHPIGLPPALPTGTTLGTDQARRPVSAPSTNGMGRPGRAMPPGGVIGGPGGGLGQPDAGRPTQRVNPVGGIIGGNRPGAVAPAAVGQLHAPAGGRPAAQRPNSASPAKAGERDNPWETDEGVAPVVLPPADRGGTDPGPAIGLPR